MSTATPEQVLESIVDGINSGNLDTLMPLYESEVASDPASASRRHGSDAGEAGGSRLAFVVGDERVDG